MYLISISNFIFFELGELKNFLTYSLILFFVTIIGSVSIYDINKKLQLLKRDAKTLSIKLEKVIRVASQIQEHVLNNVVSRIELDLRLTDAESALECYTVKNKSLLKQNLD